MGLSDIAAGIEVTTEQRDRGVATTDDTATSLDERLAPFADELPCQPTAAARLLDAYADGASIGRAAAAAGVPPTDASKALYRLGEPIDPLSPTAERVIDDWLAGELSRTEARTLANVGDAEFALGVYVATHEPIEGAEHAVADALAIGHRTDPLADTRDDVEEWM